MFEQIPLMKKSIYYSFMFLFLNSNLFAQANDFYNIGAPGQGTDLRDMHIDEYGNHVGIAAVGQSMRIFSLDSSMNVNWVKEISNGSYNIGENIVSLGNGRYLANHGTSSQMGNFNRIICFDQTGQILWNQEILGAESVWDVCALSNGNIAITGRMTSSLASWVMVIDPSGSVQWSKQIDDGLGYGLAYDILLLNDNAFLTVATVSGTNNLPRRLFTKWDFNGNVVWDKAYNYTHNPGEGEYVNSMTQTESGDIYTIGFKGAPGPTGTQDIVVRRFDIEMNHIAGKAYGHIYDDEGYDIVEDHDNKLLVVGLSKPVLNCAGLGVVLRLEQDLDTVFVKYYGVGSSSALFLRKIKRLDSMYYIPSAGGLLSSIGPLTDGHLIKSNEEINLSCAHFYQTTEVTQLPDYLPTVYNAPYNTIPISFTPTNYALTSAIQVELICSGPGPISTIGVHDLDETKFRIYPLPAQSFVTIQSESPFQTISVIDMQGRALIDLELTSTQQYNLDTSDLTSGSYFLSISDGNRTNVQRIQIQ